MRLVYDETGIAVDVGDEIKLDDGIVRVEYFSEPHKPASSGKVTVKHIHPEHWDDDDDFDREYFVGIIGAKWIDREDQ